MKQETKQVVKMHQKYILIQHHLYLNHLDTQEQYKHLLHHTQEHISLKYGEHKVEVYLEMQEEKVDTQQEKFI